MPAGRVRRAAARSPSASSPSRCRGAAARHPDLERRLRELGDVDAGNFDRIVAFDPLIAETAERVLPVWRSVPLPVADRYYRDVRPLTGHPRVGVHRPLDRAPREACSSPAKHEYDVLHLAFGVDADMLERTLDEHDVGINLHNEPYPSFENRVSLHLAAGHLVLSEPLSPSHGLEPAIDYLVVDRAGRHRRGDRRACAASRASTTASACAAAARPRASAPRTSTRGSMRDLLADVATFGTERVATAPRRSAVPSA